MGMREPIEFVTDLAAITQTAMIDQEQFQRILDNLFENSRKYGNVKDLQISLTLRQTQEGFRITFSDNGQGLPEEKIEFIFDEFYRVDESRNKKEGNGLGLYIVKNLVESMGGRVWAENQNGLSVFIELPKGESENGGE